MRSTLSEQKMARINDFRVLVVLAAGALAVAAAALVLVGPPASAASTLVVDDDKLECQNAGFTSIQDAVDAAGQGDLIRVCPGEYHESVIVDQRLTLAADDRDALDALDCFDPAVAALDPTQHVIVDPADTGFTEAFMLKANEIDLSGFVVQGASVGIDASDSFSGYRVHHNLIRQNTLFGMDFGSEGTLQSRVDHNCFRGDGLQTSSYGLVSELDDDSLWKPSDGPERDEWNARDLINARIGHNSTFRNIGGLEAVGPGHHDQVTFENNVSREDVLSILIQNSNPDGSKIVDNELSPIRFGIGVGGANDGLEITGNVVDRGEIGIIFFAPTGFLDQFTEPTTAATLSGNTVTNQRGIQAIVVSPGRLQESYLLNNTATGNAVNGIVLQAGNPDNELSGNTAERNGRNGILLNGADNNELSGNAANDNAFDGIQLVSGANNNRLLGNTAERNSRNGINAQGTNVGNLFEANTMFDNDNGVTNPDPSVTGYDARDDNRASNTWNANQCVTDLPTGTICGYVQP